MKAQMPLCLWERVRVRREACANRTRASKLARTIAVNVEFGGKELRTIYLNLVQQNFLLQQSIFKVIAVQLKLKKKQ